MLDYYIAAFYGGVNALELVSLAFRVSGLARVAKIPSTTWP